MPRHTILGYLLIVALHQGLIDIDDGPGGSGLIFVGPQHDDVDGHALAAFGEAVVPALLGAGAGGVLGGLGTRLADEMLLVPALLYQLLAHAHHVELGLAAWTPGPSGRFGRLDITPLGCFALVIHKADLNGVWPGLEDWFRDAGYLPCDGGYVHTRDLPVAISDN